MTGRDDYRWRQITVESGGLWWKATPIRTASMGMDLSGRSFYALTRSYAIRRARRAARRWNRREDRRASTQATLRL